MNRVVKRRHKIVCEYVRKNIAGRGNNPRALPAHLARMDETEWEKGETGSLRIVLSRDSLTCFLFCFV